MNQESCDINLKTIGGETPVHIAVERSFNKCAEVLVTNGANVNAQDLNGNTALHRVFLKAEMKNAFESVPVEKVSIHMFHLISLFMMLVRSRNLHMSYQNLRVASTCTQIQP